MAHNSRTARMRGHQQLTFHQQQPHPKPPSLPTPLHTLWDENTLVSNTVKAAMDKINRFKSHVGVNTQLTNEEEQQIIRALSSLLDKNYQTFGSFKKLASKSKLDLARSVNGAMAMGPARDEILLSIGLWPSHPELEGLTPGHPNHPNNAREVQNPETTPPAGLMIPYATSTAPTPVSKFIPKGWIPTVSREQLLEALLVAPVLPNGDLLAGDVFNVVVSLVQNHPDINGHGQEQF